MGKINIYATENDGISLPIYRTAWLYAVLSIAISITISLTLHLIAHFGLPLDSKLIGFVSSILGLIIAGKLMSDKIYKKLDRLPTKKEFWATVRQSALALVLIQLPFIMLFFYALMRVDGHFSIGFFTFMSFFVFIFGYMLSFVFTMQGYTWGFKMLVKNKDL